MTSNADRRAVNETAIASAIKVWYDGNKHGPTFRDLSEQTGISLGTVFNTCQRLREQGRIEFEDGKARTIKLVKRRK